MDTTASSERKASDMTDSAGGKEMVELADCPLCESKGHTLLRGFRFREDSGEREEAIMCPACGCKASLKAWNTRLAAQSAAQHEGEISADAVELGAQALANDVWHPPQRLETLSRCDANKFRRQARMVLAAALSAPAPAGEPEPEIEKLRGQLGRATAFIGEVAGCEHSDNVNIRKARELRDELSQADDLGESKTPQPIG